MRRLVTAAVTGVVMVLGAATVAAAQEVPQAGDAPAVAPVQVLTLSAFFVLTVTSLLIPLATGLVTKVMGKQRHFGEGWEEAMRLAFRILEDPRGDLAAAETIWRNAERRTDGEKVDAALKLHSMGLPFEAALRYAGFSVIEAKRLNEERIAEQLLTATLNPTPEPDASAGQPA